MDCQYFLAGRRYRRYEHHDGIRYRTNERDRFEKGDRREKEYDPRPVPDGGGRADKHGRNPRCDRRYYHGAGDQQDIGRHGGYQRPGGGDRGAVLDADRNRLRTAAVDQGGELESD